VGPPRRYELKVGNLHLRALLSPQAVLQALS